MNLQQILSIETQSFASKYSYIHSGKDCCSTAFEIKEKAEILLQIPRSIGTLKAYIEVYNEYVVPMDIIIKGKWQGIKDGCDQYIFNISDNNIGCGLYFLRPQLSVYSTTLYGHKEAGKIHFNRDSSAYGLMQLTLSDFQYSEPKKIRGGVIYHIFVDRFRRGGKSAVPDGAKIIPGVWKTIPEYPDYPGAPLYNNTFWGGTLWGIIEKLDYIKSLGTTAIYLSPIFRAASNHKYDTADYMTVDPIFGGENALKALIKACQDKNIQLILDGVFNHTGSDSIYFNKYSRYKELGAYQSKKSKYFDWFDFKEFPNKYACWWGIDILPRINPDNSNCCNYFVGPNGVIDKYSSMGIYGFRLDVADELSDEFISKIKSRLSINNSENILYGEVWEDASNKTSYSRRRHYYLGSELDGVMNYPVRSGIIDFLNHKGSGMLEYALTEVTNNAPERVLHNQMNLLGTHDTERIFTVLSGITRDGKSNSELAKFRLSPKEKMTAINRLKCAYTILSTIPGIPTIFYGDEAGLEGFGDPFNRMPYPWGEEIDILVEHFKTIGNIRTENAVYASGEFKLNYIDDQLLVFTRKSEGNMYITLVNNSQMTKKIVFDNEAEELISRKQSICFDASPYNAYIYKVKINTSMYVDQN